MGSTRDADGNPHRELDGDVIDGSPIRLDYGFQGRRHEAETGFVYFRARHYDPATGRFIQRDPEDDPANAANQYTFVGNDPATSLDPTGRTAAGVADWIDKNIVDPGVKFAQSVIELGNFRTGVYGLDYVKSAAVGWAQGLVELGGNLFKGFIVDGFRVGQGLAQGIDEWRRGERWEATKSFGVDALRAIGLFFAGVKAVRLLQPGFLRAPPVPRCFLAGTLVSTLDGARRIEDVKIGDRVLSRDERTGAQGFKRVTRLFRGQTDQVVYLKIAKAGAVQRGRSEPHEVGIADDGAEEVEADLAQQIRCTTEHPFWVERHGWIAAGELVTGDVLSSADGQPLVVVGVEIRREHAGHFNFEVEDWHTYFVSERSGAPSVWVHNLCEAGARRVLDDLDQLRAADAALGVERQTYGTLVFPRGQSYTSWNNWGNTANGGRSLGREAAAFREAGFQPGANALTIAHAEGGAFFQAFQAGERGGRATWVVDRALCGPCGGPAGVARLAQRLGLRELEVYERITSGIGEGLVVRSVMSPQTGWTQHFLGAFVE